LPYFAHHGFEALALSLRGHGKSDGHEQLNTYGLSDYVDDVAHVVRSLPSPPVLVGHSIGAVIVQQFVQSHQVPAIVLIAPTPLAAMPLAKLRWALRFLIATAKMLVTQDVNYALPTFHRLFFSTEMSEDEIDRYMGRLQKESNRVFRDISRIRHPNPLDVRVPALIVAAAQDGIPNRINQRLADDFHAELQTLPVADDIMLDPQWQLAADRIIEWMIEREPSIVA
jgi:pimeloyl-ACP methyl ester carboxylesterase